MYFLKVFGLSHVNIKCFLQKKTPGQNIYRISKAESPGMQRVHLYLLRIGNGCNAPVPKSTKSHIMG